MKSKFPTGVFKIKEGEMGEYKAIILKSSIPNMVEQEMIMVINNSVLYKIAFSTSKAQFDQHYQDFQKFLQNFVVLERNTNFSDEEIRASRVARYKRLAELYEAMDNIKEALEFVKEGLKVDPNNKELKTIEMRLQSKKK